MSNTVISVEHLSKRYELGVIGASSLQRDLNRWWARTRGRPDPYLKIGKEDLAEHTGEYIWALDDISFEVQQGEALGIIGRNGAGKSTLLKVLSQVTAPTKGKVKVKGRIGSLLEVGTGFHPELTGRENIYLNGAILGMTHTEVERKFDEIVDFSGVERFIDTPVKRYSSGMYVRLAFAVAAHLDPEILIVDEVLAVGDAEFQKKCLGKMDDVAHEGRTVLFVSHTMAAIKNLCSDAIWLENGRVKFRGSPRKTIAKYLSKNSETRNEQKWDDIQKAPGNETVRLIYAGLSTDKKNRIDYLTVESPIFLKFNIFNYRPDLPLHMNFQLYTHDGICVFNTHSKSKKYNYGTVEAWCTIPANFLNDDKYTITFMTHYPDIYGVAVENILNFEIHDSGKGRPNNVEKIIGVTRPILEWKLKSS